MKKKLSLLLITAGMFGTINTAKLYVDSLDNVQIKNLIETLENKNIEKSPKVALATGPSNNKKKSVIDIDKDDTSNA